MRLINRNFSGNKNAYVIMVVIALIGFVIVEEYQQNIINFLRTVFTKKAEYVLPDFRGSHDSPIFIPVRVRGNGDASITADITFRLNGREEGNPNLFQTADANQGIRTEIINNKLALLIPAPDGANPKSLVFDSQLEAGKWYNLRVWGISSGMVQASLNAIYSVKSQGIHSRFEINNVVLGAGFSSQRVFNGDIRNSVFVIRPARSFSFGLMAYLVFKLLFLFVVLYYIVKNQNMIDLVWVFVLCIVCVYMWQWREVPLYPDEIAYRMNSSRFFFDEGIKYGLYSECSSNAKAVPLFYYPAAVVAAGLGALPEWKLVRVVPYLSIATLLGVVIFFSRKMKKSNYLPLLFIAGFIGIAGSGYVLSRPEIYLIFHGAACLYVYSNTGSGPVSRNRAVVYLVLLYGVSLISFYSHLQGLIFAPLTFVLMYNLSKSFKKIMANVVVIMAGSYIVLAVWFSYYFEKFKCPESTNTELFISSLSLSGKLKTPGTGGIFKYVLDRIVYLERFKFIPNYQVDYLPSTNYQVLKLDWFINQLNHIIVAIAAVTLAAFVILCLYLLFIVTMKLKLIIYESTARFGESGALATSYQVAFLLTCLAHLGLLFYDTQLNFYRVFYLNIAMTVLLIVALSRAENQIIKRASIVIGILYVMVSTVSAGTANQFILPKLEAGYSGPSIPLSTDWSKVSENVQSLEMSCGIGNDEPRVIVDDKTYDAMKRHKHVIGITYLALSSEITGKTVDKLIQDVKAKYAVTRCGNFSAFQIMAVSKADDLCCTAFKSEK